MVSVIIPTFNRSNLLRETLRSVENQTIENWECIIVDDGSTDDTEEVVEQFTSKNKRFQYFKRPHSYPKGACACRNYGFELSTGKYIQWLDDDDLLSVEKLELQVRQLEILNDPQIFTTCDWDLLWKNKTLELKNVLHGKDSVNSSGFFELLTRKQTFVPPLAYLVPRKLIIEAGPWDTRLLINQDAEFFTRVLVHSKNLINTKGCYVLYREHDGERISKQNDIRKLESLLLSLRLMHAYLKAFNLNYRPYFKWRLLLVFHGYWKKEKQILLDHRYFFQENGINLARAQYYQIKHSVYKRVYPWYKRNFKM